MKIDVVSDDEQGRYRSRTIEEGERFVVSGLWLWGGCLES